MNWANDNSYKVSATSNIMGLALIWIEAMAEKFPHCYAKLHGSVGISVGADYQKGLTAYQSGDYATALREWKPLAEQGHAKALNNIGMMYGKGLGVTKNSETAAKYYRLAAEKGDALSQFNLGSMHARGEGMWRNYETAAKWYQLAAEQGLHRLSITWLCSIRRDTWL